MLCVQKTSSTALSYFKPWPLTELAMPFQIIGADHAGPIYYCTKSKKELKAYILLFTCSVSRAVNLGLTEN